MHAALAEGSSSSAVLRVVVVHKDPGGRDTLVSVAPPTGATWAPAASLQRLLSGGGVLEQYNISWGGLSFAGTRDGQPVATGGAEREAVQLVGGVYTFTVPRGSAAVLSCARAY